MRHHATEHHDKAGHHDKSGRHGSRHDHERRCARSSPREAGERGGRHRLFDHRDLRFILLSMIATRPARGYDLINALEERTGGGFSSSPGAIYPTLTMLEEQAYATVVAEDGKKLYQATPEGEAFLRDNRTTVDAIQARIGAWARERGIEPPPRIIRAVENLKTALHLRLADRPILDERAAAIAAAIDAAAAEAERV